MEGKRRGGIMRASEDKEEEKTEKGFHGLDD